MFRQKIILTSVLLLQAGTAMASTITDDFESYAIGSFPSPTWADVGEVVNQGQTLPTASIVSTTDAFGTATQALAIRDELGSSRGIYAPTALGRFYSLAADIRVDRYTTDSIAEPSDWAMQLTFAHNGVTSYDTTPQAGIYASALTQGWRLFLIGENSLSADIDLGVAADVSTWYRVSLDADTLTGTFHTQIFDVFSGVQLLNNIQTLTGWHPNEANWDSIAFFGGDLSGSTANLAVVDNVNISSTGTPVPEPVSALLMMMGLGVLGLRKHTNIAR